MGCVGIVLTELYHSGQSVLAHVVIDGNVFAFDGHIAVELHFFAGDAAAVNDGLSHGYAAEGESLDFLEVFALVGYGKVENVTGKLHEISIVGHEVGFTLQGDDGGKAIFVLSEHTAFGGIAVGTLGCDSLSLGADDFDGGVDIVVRLFESLFAIGQTGAGKFAQFGDVCYCYCHSFVF